MTTFGTNFLFWLSLIGPLSAIAYFFHVEHKREMELIRCEMESIRQSSQQQANRTDRLYEMFIDLLKDKKKVK